MLTANQARAAAKTALRRNSNVEAILDIIAQEALNGFSSTTYICGNDDNFRLAIATLRELGYEVSHYVEDGKTIIFISWF